MRTFLLILTLSAGVLHSYSQGTIVYYNRVAGSVVAPVYGLETPDSSVMKVGNTSAGFPAGTQTYTGPLLAGTGYSVGLWAGPEGSSELAFVPGSLNSFRTGGFAGAINNSGGVIAIPGVSEGSRAALQLRAWDNIGGTITSWEGTFAPTYFGSRGASAIFTSPLLGGNAPPPNMAGLQSFHLYPVPEPSVIGLMVLSAFLFLGRRRRGSA
jgi:hypothetical protein